MRLQMPGSICRHCRDHMYTNGLSPLPMTACHTWDHTQMENSWQMSCVSLSTLGHLMAD